MIGNLCRMDFFISLIETAALYYACISLPLPYSKLRYLLFIHTYAMNIALFIFMHKTQTELEFRRKACGISLVFSVNLKHFHPCT